MTPRSWIGAQSQRRHVIGHIELVSSASSTHSFDVKLWHFPTTQSHFNPQDASQSTVSHQPCVSYVLCRAHCDSLRIVFSEPSLPLLQPPLPPRPPPSQSPRPRSQLAHRPLILTMMMLKLKYCEALSEAANNNACNADSWRETRLLMPLRP